MKIPKVNFPYTFVLISFFIAFCFSCLDLIDFKNTQIIIAQAQPDGGDGGGGGGGGDGSGSGGGGGGGDGSPNAGGGDAPGGGDGTNGIDRQIVFTGGNFGSSGKQIFNNRNGQEKYLIESLHTNGPRRGFCPKCGGGDGDGGGSDGNSGPVVVNPGGGSPKGP